MCGNHPPGVSVLFRNRLSPPWEAPATVDEGGEDERPDLAGHPTRVGRNSRADPGVPQTPRSQGAHDVRPVGSKYLLEEPLGRGATGTVWRARQRETAGSEAAVAGQPGETVAIKVLKEELANDADIVMRFLRERSVLLRLTHENIVRTRDLVVEGDLLALVMDLIDGPDLHRYLRENGPLTPVAAALLTAQIADALAASHADGVVHRDLKPANVLLDERDGQMHPMLTDFGIARLADSPGLTRTHEFVGTPAYVAPESAEGRPQTSAVDIYGAGILLYELVTGRPPFSGGTALEVLHRHLSEEPRRPTTVPAPLWTVIERCLSKDPDQRPSAENLARGLRTVAAGIGVHANAAQIAAADGVGALLAPDPAPAAVPQTPARPTRRRCCRATRARTIRTPRPASCSTPPARARAGTPTRPRSCRPYRRIRTTVRSPTGRTPGSPSSRRPVTATSRRRSSTSTPARTRCAAVPSGPSLSSSSRSSPSDASSRRSISSTPSPGSSSTSRNPSTINGNSPNSSSARPRSSRRRSSRPRDSPASRGSAAPTR